MWKALCHEEAPLANFEFLPTNYFCFNEFSSYFVQCFFHVVSGGPFLFTEFRSMNSVSHPKRAQDRVGMMSVLTGFVRNKYLFNHNLLFDYEVVRYLDGFFEPSSLVLSARFDCIF